MRSVLFLAILSISSANAAEKILDCTFNDGPVAGFTILRASNGDLSYKILSNHGHEELPVALSAEALKARDISFSYGRENYRFFSENKGRSWRFTATSEGSVDPNIDEGAYCD